MFRLQLTLLVLLPLTAHAWSVSILWERVGREDSSGYGALILPLGDQNEDGYADWAVYAGPPFGGGHDSAYVEFFHGGDPPGTTPYATYTAAQAGEGAWRLGGAWTMGDVNGDGFEDWWVNVQFHENWQWFEAQLFWGGPEADLVPDALWHFHWQYDDERFRSLGDFNGDGYDDLYKWRGREDIGWACFGGTVFDTIPDWSRTSPPDSASQTFAIGHGDLNGDGFGDWVGYYAPDPARAYVFWGSAQPDTVPGYVLPVASDYAYPWVLPDLNADGRDEFAVTHGTHIDLYWGRATLGPAPDAVLTFPCPASADLYPAGDVNGDGWGDFLARGLMCDGSGNGLIALYLGSPWPSAQPAWVVQDRGGPPYLVGVCAAKGVGDVNGDGIGDFALGATNDDNDGTRGKAVILSGDSTARVSADEPFIPHPSSFVLSVFPNPFNSTTTLRFALPSSSEVKLALYDMTGRVVMARELGRLAAGEHAERVDGEGLASGIYFVSLSAASRSVVQKVALVR